MYFIGISRLIFANQESFKNRTEAVILKRINVCVFKICKYNTILCFQLIRKKLCFPSTVTYDETLAVTDTPILKTENVIKLLFKKNKRTCSS